MTPTKWTSCAAEGPMPAEATIAVARDFRPGSAFECLNLSLALDWRSASSAAIKQNECGLQSPRHSAFYSVILSEA